MAFVRLLKDLMKDQEIGCAVRADHPRRGAHVRHGLAVPDREDLLPARPALHRRSTASSCCPTRRRPPASDPARGHQRGRLGRRRSRRSATSYATHGEPMIPIYIFYSMFGFQRTGDGFWAAGDQMARGFVLGATAGRTTLNGEGLQHEDGHSPLLASTNPAVRRLRPGVRLRGRPHRQGRRCAGCTATGRRTIFYYLTVYNEPYPQPARARRTSTSRASCGASTAGRRRRRATGPRRSCWPQVSRCSGPWRRSSCCARTGACRPTSGR